MIKKYEINMKRYTKKIENITERPTPINNEIGRIQSEIHLTGFTKISNFSR